MKDLNKGHRFQKMGFVLTVTVMFDAEFYTTSYAECT